MGGGSLIWARLPIPHTRKRVERVAFSMFICCKVSPSLHTAKKESFPHFYIARTLLQQRQFQGYYVLVLVGNLTPLFGFRIGDAKVLPT